MKFYLSTIPNSPQSVYDGEMDRQQLVTLLQTEKAGFKLVQTEAEKALATLSATEALQLARQMYESDVYQARMFAVLI